MGQGQGLVTRRALPSRLPWVLPAAVLFRVRPGPRHFVFPSTLSMHTTGIATQALDHRAGRSARNVTNQEHNPRPQSGLPEVLVLVFHLFLLSDATPGDLGWWRELLQDLDLSNIQR